MAVQRCPIVDNSRTRAKESCFSCWRDDAKLMLTWSLVQLQTIRFDKTALRKFKVDERQISPSLKSCLILLRSNRAWHQATCYLCRVNTWERTERSKLPTRSTYWTLQSRDMSTASIDFSDGTAHSSNSTSSQWYFSLKGISFRRCGDSRRSRCCFRQCTFVCYKITGRRLTKLRNLPVNRKWLWNNAAKFWTKLDQSQGRWAIKRHAVTSSRSENHTDKSFA